MLPAKALVHEKHERHEQIQGAACRERAVSGNRYLAFFRAFRVFRGQAFVVRPAPAPPEADEQFTQARLAKIP
jgi:hypothetical protein